MSVKNFKFVSPGVFVNEIDNSFIPKSPSQIGPVVVGRTARGPAMRPVTISSFSDYIRVFGNPIPGANGGDVWRDGNNVGPTYAAYAAQAYLASNVTPLTVMRLLGTQHTDANTAGKAGWSTSGSADTDPATDAGAYGLFLFPSGAHTTATTGTLAAVWYMHSASIALSGALRDPAGVGGGEGALTGNAVLMPSAGTDHEFSVRITSPGDTKLKNTAFNFSRTSDKFIRQVFNTNPQLVNSSHTQATSLEQYWLGETYEQSVDRLLSDSTAAGEVFGVMLAMSDGTYGYEDQKAGMQDGHTGWFIAQDTSTDKAAYIAEAQQKLFRFIGLNYGEELQKNFKISIQDIKKPTNPDVNPYGTFAIVFRALRDTDQAVRVVERYDNLSLNPNSSNYIARRIGDEKITWSDAEARYRVYGNYVNQSKYIRVEMNQDVDEGSTDAGYLPFGVFGPPRPKTFVLMPPSTGAIGAGLITGDSAPWAEGATDQSHAAATNLFVEGEGNIVFDSTATNGSTSSAGAAHLYAALDGTVDDFLWMTGAFVYPGSGSYGVDAGSAMVGYTASIEFPRLQLRNSASDGGFSDPTNAYFGPITTRGATSALFDESVTDHLKSLSPEKLANTVIPTADYTVAQYVFSMDELVAAGSATVYYESGSRAAGDSATSASWGAILDLGYDRFTTCFHAGRDGLDITEKEPFGEHAIATNNEYNSYEYNTIKRAFDTCADPEYVEMNAITMPGLRNNALTNHLTRICESRADALAIIDLDGGYTPTTETTNDATDRRGTVTAVISNLKNRNFNSSYACAFYPWVQIRDTIADSMLWVPPSVAALGTFASSQKKSELWFAPAGFNRGGLSDGAAGIPVTNVSERLTSKDRDNLYAQNINPIASFPAEGIVVFGQKTLQTAQSAVDRINVRRLMIFVKKEISRKATSILFDQNVDATWNRFKGQVEPFLASIKARFGLTEYRLILDKSTTTPDLIDQNILYAKILLKPARAIEFIAIDFVIASTGASFDD